jgi:hypothetical protein
VFRHIGNEELALDWWRIGPMLAPGMRFNPTRTTIQDVFDKLMAGQCTCLEVIVPGGSGYIVFEMFGEGEGVKCFTSYIAGRSSLKPKAWVAAVRNIMTEFEARLQDAGCTENFIGGRDWSRVFPDYQPADDVTNRLKKVLA